jgi:hypothetical protein
MTTDFVPHDLARQALRLIGNSCADTDENRARVVSQNYLYPIFSKLSDLSLINVVIPVTYNICVDYGELEASFLTEQH